MVLNPPLPQIPTALNLAVVSLQTLTALLEFFTVPDNCTVVRESPSKVGAGARLIPTKLSVPVWEAAVPMALDLFGFRASVEGIVRPGGSEAPRCGGLRSFEDHYRCRCPHHFPGPDTPRWRRKGEEGMRGLLTLVNNGLSDMVKLYPRRNEPPAPLRYRPTCNIL